jgi:hypothetical protein
MNADTAAKLAELADYNARVKAERPCYYCERRGEPLAPCCASHPDDLVCADRTGCRDFLLTQLADDKPLPLGSCIPEAER